MLSIIGLLYDKWNVILLFMRNALGKPLLPTEVEALKRLLDERNITVSQFAVTEAKVHPQTIYEAINGRALQKRTRGLIMDAINRLSGDPAKTAS